MHLLNSNAPAHPMELLRRGKEVACGGCPCSQSFEELGLLCCHSRPVEGRQQTVSPEILFGSSLGTETSSEEEELMLSRPRPSSIHKHLQTFEGRGAASLSCDDGYSWPHCNMCCVACFPSQLSFFFFLLRNGTCTLLSPKHTNSSFSQCL